MRDITAKSNTLRAATARARLHMRPETIVLMQEGRIPKGNPLEVAKVSGIQAAKRTSDIIPYCHPVPVAHVAVQFDVGDEWIDSTVTVKAMYKTGVEMEALTGATVVALTLYDMMKMVDETMYIGEVRLERKSGGKTDLVVPAQQVYKAAVVVVSDRVSAGQAEDISGTIIREQLRTYGLDVVDYAAVPDDLDAVRRSIQRLSDDLGVDLIMTTGGTGFGPRDLTPEALETVIKRRTPGIDELVRRFGGERTPFAMLSRSSSGLRGSTLIISLPGSPGAVRDALDALFPAILHSFPMIEGRGHNRQTQ